MDSDKENLTSARDNSAKAFIHHQKALINVFNYEEKTRNSNKQPFSNTLKSNLSGKERTCAQDLDTDWRKSAGTFRKPMSIGSTSTLIINEKAKALKNEISTLDEEIIQLQNNLKKAIKRKDSKNRI